VGYGPFSLCVIHKESLCPSSEDINRLILILLIVHREDDQFGVEGHIPAYSRGRRFDSRTVETFVCMKMSVCIRFGCFYV
jgi:hypothetical protein